MVHELADLRGVLPRDIMRLPVDEIIELRAYYSVKQMKKADVDGKSEVDAALQE